MKNGIFYVLFLFIFFSPAFSSSSNVNTSLISWQENYSIGEKLNFSFYLNFTDLTPDYYLESSEGHKILLRDLLRINGNPLSCESFGCERILSPSSSQFFSSARIRIVEKNQYLIGLEITDSSFLRFEGLDIKLKTFFPESDYSPLQINLINKEAWKFKNQTNNFLNIPNYGCFNTSKPFSYNKIIGEDKYCEKIFINSETSKVLLGANFLNNNENKHLIMSLLDSRRNLLGSCNFISSERNFCDLSFQNKIIQDHYFVCINSNSSTNIYLGFQENQNSCGYFRSFSSSSGDYSIFLIKPKHVSVSGEINIFSKDITPESINAVNSYLNKFYRNNCSSGCFIPIIFSGINQTLEISEIKTRYSSIQGNSFSTKVRNLTIQNPKVSFRGNVNLSLADFIVNESGIRNITFFLVKDSEKIPLFSRRINVSSVPIILDLYPKKVPSLVNVTLNLEYFLRNGSFIFVWNFSNDGIIKTTNTSNVNYIFRNISLYEVEVSIKEREKELTRKKFLIETFLPKNISKDLLLLKKEFNSNFNNKLEEKLTKTISDKIIDSFNLKKIENDLISLERDLETKTLDEEILFTAEKIFNIAVPTDFSIIKKEEPFFLLPEQISSDILRVSLSENVSSSEEDYKKYISYWSVKNLDNNSKKRIQVVNIKDNFNKTLASFLILDTNILPLEDSFLLISSQNILYSSSQGESIQGFKKFLLNKGTESRFSFILNGTTDPSILVFPKDLSKVHLSVKELGVCNFNKLCEKNLGENYKNCRRDCKPVLLVIIILLIIFVFFIIAYLIVNIKLKERYEKSLFKSSKDLLNLISFFKSYKEKGLSREEAMDKLVKQGYWSREQAEYAAKKAEREGVTSQFELISIEKIKKILNKK